MTPAKRLRGAFYESTWRARVECKREDMVISRPVEAPAENAEQAAERMLAAIRSVWPGWTVRFIQQPTEVK